MHRYSVKAKCQGGNIWAIDVVTTQKAKFARYSARNLQNFCILLEIVVEGLTSRESAAGSTYCMSLRMHSKT